MVIGTLYLVTFGTVKTWATRTSAVFTVSDTAAHPSMANVPSVHRYFAPPPTGSGSGTKYCDEYVCLSVRLHISKTTCLNCMKSPVPVRVNCTMITLIGSRPSDHYFRSVCLSVCWFVCAEFSQPSLIRFQSNLDICYMSGSSCVP